MANPDRPDPFLMPVESLVGWLNDNGVAVYVKPDGSKALVGNLDWLTVEVKAALVERAEDVLYWLRPDLRPFGPIFCEDAVDRWLLRQNPQIRTPAELHLARMNRRAQLDMTLTAAVAIIKAQKAAGVSPYDWQPGEAPTEPVEGESEETEPNGTH